MQTMELFTMRKAATLTGVAGIVLATMASAQAASTHQTATTITARSTPAGTDLYDAKCGMRIREMVTDALAFVIDNDGRFPTSPKTFAQEIVDDGGSVVPSDTSNPPTALFSYNLALAGSAKDDVRDPAHTVLVYEGGSGRLVFRHDARAIIAYVDGHVDEITTKEAAGLKWKP